MVHPMTAPGTTSLSRRLVLVMACATGLAVANNYYAQPLLATIAEDLHVSSSTAGLLVTVAQLGYAAGLVLLVPLGDLVERRRLVTSLLGVAVVALLGMAAAPDLPLLAAAALFVGLTTVVAQILVPFAATLAGEHERGRVVGTVMSGLLLGILLARTVAGVIADAFGWRAVYLTAAGLMVALAVVLWRELPTSQGSHESSYGQLLRSVWELLRRERVLRFRAFYGACSFGSFSVFWTSAAFLLDGPPYHYSDRVIGLFGLVGAAGALAASAAGRLADRGWARVQTAGFLACALVSWLPIALGAHHLAPLVVGVLLMDLGVQGLHITNQSQIYALQADARARLTTAYMTSYFLGGALGSLVGASLFDAFGWTGTCVAGAGFVAVALAAWFAEQRG